MYFAWSVRLLTAPVKPKKSTVAFAACFTGLWLVDVKGIKGIRYAVLDFTAEAIVGEKSGSELFLKFHLVKPRCAQLKS